MLISPLDLPLQAAFGSSNWWTGFLLSLALAAAGLAALWYAAEGISLSWAAQESQGIAAHQAAIFTGQPDQAQELATRQRLGAERQASRLPLRPGISTLLWKQAVQATRSFRWQELGSWLIIFGAALTLTLVSGWETQVWGLLIWVVAVGQQSSRRFRIDLTRWTLTRQLPFSSARLLGAELALPWGLSVLLTWLALAIGSAHPLALRLLAGLMAPIVAACAALAAAYDILRQSKASMFLAEVSADYSAIGAILGLICAGIPVGIVAWALQRQLPLAIAGLAALTVSLLAVSGLWRLVTETYRKIE